MDEALRAGVAVFNAGHHHAAHDAWEEKWLGLDDGTPDERFLHGLIQYTAVVYHARTRNWSGAAGLAESARGYLAGLDDPYRGVELSAVRAYLRRLAADPETAERVAPPPLVSEGRPLALDDLDAGATLRAATALAASADRFDEETVAAAAAYAREELAARGDGPFLALVMDFARGDAPAVTYERLSTRVDRRQQRDRDVDGLFD